ncbi:MAG: diheme cytochrome c-553 [Phaeodactylibacter sp.]|nr:diheme cytochrome c-553 [Phaeodactylibacter sp.]
MKKRTPFFLFLLSTLLLTHCTEQPSTMAAKADAPAAPSPEELAKRGEYLVTIMGCHDCHSPKRMGPQGPEIIPELMLSGYPAGQPVPEVEAGIVERGLAVLTPDLTAAIGPWGVSFAANITSHETGIGNWTEEQFRKALTEGKSKGLDGTRPLLPPMPWFNYVNIQDEDLKAIFAYLKSTNPVENVAPNPIPPGQPN